MEYNHDIFNASPAQLGVILDRYPWFTTARIRRSVLTGEADPLLSLNLLTKPWPAAMLVEQAALNEDTAVTVSPVVETPLRDETTEIIDRFLSGGDRRIVPTDDTPTGDVAEDSSVFVPDEELDTGELERIYRDQGLELMNDDVSEITGEVLGIVDDE